METNRILVVDDDRDLVELLRFSLSRSGFEVLPAHDVDEAVALLSKRPDLAVLDINLGAHDGFELLGQIRGKSNLPIIMLTARDTEDDTVRALQEGADDYITKPFSHRELIARIRASLRRARTLLKAAAPEAAVLEVGPVKLDRSTHQVWRDGQQISLTVTEFRLLHYLMINGGVVVPTGEIIRHVWGHNDLNAGDVVRTTVHRLRRKLGDDTAQDRLVQTVPRVGFMFSAENTQ